MHNDFSNKAFLEMAEHFGNIVCRAYYSGKAYNEFKDYSVYDGSAGISLFLLELYRQSGDEYYRNVGLEVFENAWKYRNKALKDPFSIISFYSGWTGLAYTAISIGRNIDNDEYINRGLQLINQLFQFDITKFSVDVTNGIAGAIPALIKINNHYPSDKIEDLIYQLGNQLLVKAVRDEIGWSWKTMPNVMRNLTGHSHGNAGIITALFELYAFTNDSQFYDAAYEGLKYERYHYNDEERNWPDFRIDPKGDPSEGPKYPCYWCHGAAGIALSRIRCFEIIKDYQILEEINIALDTTVSRSSFLNRSNASLCHGVLGNANILLYAGLSLKDDWLVNFVIDNGFGGIRKHYDRHVPWVNGIHDKEYIPGLMMGFSGFGYAYLRLYNPEAVPMVMLIHPDESM